MTLALGPGRLARTVPRMLIAPSPRSAGARSSLGCAFTNRMEDPAVEGIIGNFRDISEQRLAEHARN